MTRPVNITPPVIRAVAPGDPVLTSSVGKWEGSPTNYTRRWFLNGRTISGATSSRYTRRAADLLGDVTCTVSARNSAGWSPQVASNAIGPVSPPPAAPEPTPTPTPTPPPGPGGLTLASAPSGVTVTGTGDAWRVNVPSGPYAAGSPYPFSRAALEAAGLLELAHRPTTGGTTAGATRTAVDPLVVGLESAGQILQTRAWTRGGSPIVPASTGLTHAVVTDDVQLGLGIAFRAQNDVATATRAVAAFAGQPFAHADDAGLAAWLDAERDQDVTYDGTRMIVADRKGGAAWVSSPAATAAARPTRANGVITFAAAGLQRPAPAGTGLLGTTLMLVRMDPTSATWPYPTVSGLVQVAGAFTDIQMRFRSPTEFRPFIRNVENVSHLSEPASAAGATAMDNGAWCIVEHVRTEGRVEIHVDGVLNHVATYAPGGTYAPDTLGVFGRPDSQNGSAISRNNAKGKLAVALFTTSTGATARALHRARLASRRDALIAGGF